MPHILPDRQAPAVTARSLHEICEADPPGQLRALLGDARR
jgi:hypothetical protein